MQIRQLITRKRLTAVVISGATAIIGAYLIVGSHAATPTSSFEAENSTLTGSASQQNDSSASGGKAIQFGNLNSSTTTYGVLQANTTHLTTDTQAGLRLAEIEVGWDNWEPGLNNFSTSYANQIKSNIAAYKAAGWQVAVSIGLQYPPGWVLALPNGQLVDQNGVQSGTANFQFNQTIRTDAAAYINNVVTTIGVSNVDYYRVGLSDAGEMLIGPSHNNNNWWAFDALAQGSASGLATGVATSPLPGWIPGSSTYNGQAVTRTQVQSWYDWYLGATTNAETWEINSFRTAGYSGKIQLVMPGLGAVPTLYDRRIAANLAPDSLDPYNTMGTAAAYQLVLNALPLQNTVIDISSVSQDSNPTSNASCQASDASLPLASADPWNTHWSSVRWLTYLANQHSLQVVGENPGSNSTTDMATDFTLVKSCHLIALQWAFDAQLYDGSHASLNDYSAQIKAAP